jgi:transcriptional regulator with XRE-family HTH domain
VVAQSGWQARLTQVSADQVRRYRKQRNMSAQMLSDRCAELGFAIPRPVLSNLENGRREAVSLAELLILAAALEVPPLLLIAPVGLREDLEILPTANIPTWDAAKWVTGEHLSSKPDEATVLDYYRAHDATVAAWRKLMQNMAESIAADDERSARTYRTAADQQILDLTRIRKTMQERSLLLPSLPPDLHAIEGAWEPSNGRARRQAERDLDLEAGS